MLAESKSCYVRPKTRNARDPFPNTSYCEVSNPYAKRTESSECRWRDKLRPSVLPLFRPSDNRLSLWLPAFQEFQESSRQLDSVFALPPRFHPSKVHYVRPMAFTFLSDCRLLGPRSLIISFNWYSNIAGVIAGQLFRPRYAPSYGYPLKVTVVVLISVGMLGFISMRGIYMYTNYWRAEKIADWDEQQRRAEDREESGRRGDKRWTFVYCY